MPLLLPNPNIASPKHNIPQHNTLQPKNLPTPISTSQSPHPYIQPDGNLISHSKQLTTLSPLHHTTQQQLLAFCVIVSHSGNFHPLFTPPQKIRDAIIRERITFDIASPIHYSHQSTMEPGPWCLTSKQLIPITPFS